MIHPIQIHGNWDEGYALDIYSISSEYLGDDDFGRPRFNTTRTEIGELLYSMKYNGHHDTSIVIADACADFVREWLDGKAVKTIIPVPPTNARYDQPVTMIAFHLSERLGIVMRDDVIVKTSNVQAKSMPKEGRSLAGAIQKLLPAKKKCSILLIDDLIETGATANECVSVLKSDPNIEKVYFLAIAKKRT